MVWFEQIFCSATMITVIIIYIWVTLWYPTILVFWSESKRMQHMLCGFGEICSYWKPTILHSIDCRDCMINIRATFTDLLFLNYATDCLTNKTYANKASNFVTTLKDW